jgi:hypothetical protein
MQTGKTVLLPSPTPPVVINSATESPAMPGLIFAKTVWVNIPPPLPYPRLVLVLCFTRFWGNTWEALDA